MAVEHVLATAISNLGAVPQVMPTTGQGMPGVLREVGGSLIVPAAASVNSTFRLCTVPSDAKIKNVMLSSGAQAAGAVDIGVYYPIWGKTGKPDLAANAIDQDLFATAVDLASAISHVDVTLEGGAFTTDEELLPLWQVLGLSFDPGGFFDIVATVATTAVTTGTGRLSASVRFVQ